MSVERYNPRLGAVEPVVEPFGAEAALVCSFHTSANLPGADIVVRARESVHAAVDYEALRHAASLFGAGAPSGDALAQIQQERQQTDAAVANGAEGGKEGAFVLCKYAL